MFAMLDADADRKKRKRHQQPAEVHHQSSSPRIQSTDDVRDETGAWQNTASFWEYDYYRRRQIDHDYYRRRYHDYIHDYFTSAEEALTVEANAAAPEVTPPPAKAPPAVAEPEAAEAESSAGASVEEAKDAEPEVSPPVEALFPEDLPPPADPPAVTWRSGGSGQAAMISKKKTQACTAENLRPTSLPAAARWRPLHARFESTHWHCTRPQLGGQLSASGREK